MTGIAPTALMNESPRMLATMSDVFRWQNEQQEREMRKGRRG